MGVAATEPRNHSVSLPLVSYISTSLNRGSIGIHIACEASTMRTTNAPCHSVTNSENESETGRSHRNIGTKPAHRPGTPLRVLCQFVVCVNHTRLPSSGFRRSLLDVQLNAWIWVCESVSVSVWLDWLGSETEQRKFLSRSDVCFWLLRRISRSPLRFYIVTSECPNSAYL